MAAISWTFNRGTEGFKFSDFTTGTNAPSAGDFELRYNTTDAQSKNVTRKDVILFLQASIRQLEQGQLLTTAPPL
jgi:hypothetical protein